MSLLLALTGGGGSKTLAIAATEPQDVAAFALTVGHPLTLAATESRDVAAFALTVTGGAASLTMSFAASESVDTASFSLRGSDTGGWRGPGGERHDDVLHRAFTKGIPPRVESAIERTVKDATVAESRSVLEAQIDRAGEAWDERFYSLLQEMRRRELDTLRDLIAWQEQQHELMLMDDDDAIAVVMMLH